MVKDTNKKLYNFFLYLKRNKVEIAKQLLYNIKLGQVRLEVIKEKIRNKIRSIIVLK